MSEHWDFYLSFVNEKPASLFVDLGLRDEVPDPERGWLLWVQVHFQTLREDGMYGAEEGDALMRIEELLIAAVGEGLDAPLVGCITSDGHRDFYFYGASFAGFEELIAQAMAAEPGYRWEAGTDHDPDWNHYLDILYPTPHDWQCMQNRHVVEQLEEHGDVLEKARPVSHWAYFADAPSRDQFVAAIENLGFTITATDESDADENDSENPFSFSAQFERVDSVDWCSINDVTLELFDLAESCAGNYDGWETSIVQE